MAPCACTPPRGPVESADDDGARGPDRDVPLDRHRGEHAALGRSSGRRWRVALEAHDALLRAAVERAGGTVVKTTGDGILAAFDRPEAALAAAIEGQLALERHAWPTTGPLRVRMAIHSGSAEVRDGDFFGPDPQPGGAPPGDRTWRPGARLGHDARAGRRRSPARVRADRPGRASPARPGPARARLPARRRPGCDASSRRSERPPSTPRTSGPRSPRSWDASGSWPTSRGCSRSSRLVTLVGVGGTGKTRLELQVAARCPRPVPRRRLAGRARAASATRTSWSPRSAAPSGSSRQPGQPPIDTVVDYLRVEGAAPAPRQLRAPHRAPPPTWRIACSAAAPPSACSPRAASHSASTARPCSPCPRWRCRRPPMSTTWHAGGRRRAGRAGRSVRGGPALRRARDGNPAVVRARSVERARRRRDLPAARRHPARPRARGRPGERPLRRRDRPGPRATGSAC